MQFNTIPVLSGDSRQLKVTSINQLSSALSSKSLPELKDLGENDVISNCHLVAAGCQSATKTFVATATADYLSLYKWDNNTREFHKVKVCAL